jgi:Tfp pilus assembly protein PilV
MTLVEVMVASLLVGFGLASSLAAYTAAARASEAASRRIEAVHTARRVMEELRSKSYYALEYGTTQVTNGISYTVTAASGFSATKDIELKVDWNNPGQGEPAQIVLQTSVALCLHQ